MRIRTGNDAELVWICAFGLLPADTVDDGAAIETVVDLADYATGSEHVLEPTLKVRECSR